MDKFSPTVYVMQKFLFKIMGEFSPTAYVMQKFLFKIIGEFSPTAYGKKFLKRPTAKINSTVINHTQNFHCVE